MRAGFDEEFPPGSQVALDANVATFTITLKVRTASGDSVVGPVTLNQGRFNEAVGAYNQAVAAQQTRVTNVPYTPNMADRFGTYTPWLLGGAAVLAVGALIYLKRRKR
jgi:hypothetical protein